MPSDHKLLAQYRRGGFTPQDVPKPPVGDHGSFVASRVVFGDCESHDALMNCAGTCSFYDVVVADFPSPTQPNPVNDKVVMDAFRGVRGAAPDVRVFNMSFGDSRPLSQFSDVDRREKRLSLQDLDNFIFSNDILVVVAAGNSLPGVIPTTAYPEHFNDDQWALGPWACGYNTLVCGAYVNNITTNGLVKQTGWPSPFSRIGPGLCESPVPSFAASGGNSDDNYRATPGLGVWGLSGSCHPEDRAGTSHAAPLLSRECAIAFNALQKFCLPGTQPFSVLVKAFFALTATKTADDDRVNALIKRTMGFGHASARRIDHAVAGSAVILWQGYIESKSDKVRVQLPIPLEWLNAAEEPILRVALCYDPPVNEVAIATWACRRVKAVLHLNPDGESVRAPSGVHPNYPLAVREYKLGKYKAGQDKAVEGDMWLMELSYEEVAAYPPGMVFDSQQRVAFAAELLDRADSPVDPQPMMQALPIAMTMTRLSTQTIPIRTPVIIRSRRNS